MLIMALIAMQDSGCATPHGQPLCYCGVGVGYDQGRCGHWKLDLHKKLCLLGALGDPGVYKQDL